jgi:dUTP pyrophosphatase
MQKKTKVRFNKIHPDAIVPAYGTPLSAGFDLASVETIRLFPGQSGVFPTGLIVQAPHNHMLLVVPRSSTFRKWSVALGNTVGVVDEDFCGPEDELRLYVYAHNTTAIPAGTRLAQGIFVPITRAIFVEQEEAIAKTRGGWGSTGD